MECTADYRSSKTTTTLPQCPMGQKPIQCNVKGHTLPVYTCASVSAEDHQHTFTKFSTGRATNVKK